jgi:hypothetical protein
MVTKNNQSPAQTKPSNVTDLTPEQKHELFAGCITKAGFTSFTKKKLATKHTIWSHTKTRNLGAKH